MATDQTSRSAALGPQLSNAELAAWRGFLRTHHEMIASLDRELERRHGLPLTSYEVLLQIADSPTGTLRMSDIAERVLLSRSGLTRLVDRLERDGLVRRRTCPSDLRGQNAELTERGREVFADARSDAPGRRSQALPGALRRARAGDAGRPLGALRRRRRHLLTSLPWTTSSW